LPCGKDIYAASRIAGGLAARNIAVLRFDFTGIGSSEGEFANTNFSSNAGSGRGCRLPAPEWAGCTFNITKQLEIADRCPVHQTLSHEVKIRSRLAPGPTEICGDQSPRIERISWPT
jgi:hypothetical protein